MTQSILHTVNDLIQSPDTIRNWKIGKELYYFYILSYTLWLGYFMALDTEITSGYEIHRQIISTIHTEAPQ